MTHEPECLVPRCIEVGRADKQMHEQFGICYSCACICGELEAAYQRGRDDAAEAVATVKDYHGGDSVLVNRDFAVSAARGDGEQV